jgi:diguanylate cyclase (GGDEF)-like protein
MSDTLEPDKILARLMRSARTLLDCDRAWMVSREADGRCVLTESGFYGETARDVPADRATTALLARDEPVAGTDIAMPKAIADRLPGARAWLVLPLRSRTASIGALVLGSTDADSLMQRSEVASALVAQGLTAYDNASLFARVQNLAVVDELTGIANRRRFMEMADRDLEAAIRHGRPLAAMMIDIDHFKNINDTYGHPTGDDVIRAVANRLTEHARRTDLLGRYGGEEFALLLPETVTRTCRDLAERLRAGVADVPIPTRSGPLTVTVSVGFTARGPSDPDLAALLSRADEALYEAKKAGRNRVSEA